MRESFGWGLLGPDALIGVRRTRTLGLASVVRYFNDRAVPGLGGVWYSKQLFLALLGVVVAGRAKTRRASNIQVANAIEALACWVGFEQNGWVSEPRLRGREKLQSKNVGVLPFRYVKQPGFYLTQPMRMQTVQALPALGFVTASGERFNSFVPTQEGRDFVEAVCKGFRPFNRDVVSYLVQWVEDGKVSVGNTKPLCEVLSPLEALPDDARKLLQERLMQGNTIDAKRRSNAWNWIETLKAGSKTSLSAELQEKPAEIDEDHWRDIQAGALFFSLRDSAFAVLDAVEGGMAQECSLDDGATKAEAQLVALQGLACEFVGLGHQARQDALDFCKECAAESSVDALRSLIKRDGTVLKWGGEKIERGPAFQGWAVDEASTGDEPAGDTPVPTDLSYRLRNLYRLNLDLHGELDAWLKQTQGEGEHRE